MTMRILYHKKKIHARAAALILAGAVLLGGSVLGGRDTARAVEDEPAQVGFLLITGMAPQTEEPRHPVLTFRASDPALCAGIEAPEIEPEPEPQEATPEEAAPEEVRTYLGSFKITGYDTCARCCGNTRGITASGTTATVGRTCAASKDIPFGTRLWIEGIGERVVEDRGGAVNGKKIDVLCADHPACYAITGTYEVYIIEEAQE